jgi:hypothetical protein
VARLTSLISQPSLQISPILIVAPAVLKMTQFLQGGQRNCRTGVACILLSGNSATRVTKPVHMAYVDVCSISPQWLHLWVTSTVRRSLDDGGEERLHNASPLSSTTVDCRHRYCFTSDANLWPFLSLSLWPSWWLHVRSFCNQTPAAAAVVSGFHRFVSGRRAEMMQHLE